MMKTEKVNKLVVAVRQRGCFCICGFVLVLRGDININGEHERIPL